MTARWKESKEKNRQHFTISNVQGKTIWERKRIMEKHEKKKENCGSI